MSALVISCAACSRAPDALPSAGSSDRPVGSVAAVAAVAAPELLIADPATLIALERGGLAFGRQLGAPGEDGRHLLASPRYAALVAVIAGDLAELAQRPGVARSQFPLDLERLNYVFDPRWLRSPDTHFELVGVSNRLDMQFATPGECGQLRLIYRLALQATGRPVVRLPMTINVIRHLPMTERGSCAAFAQRWRALPTTAAERAAALAQLVSQLTPIRRVETNFQNLHGPGTPFADDHAEYVLRSFDVVGDRLVPRLLLNTPRPDLDAGERAALAAWISDHFADIDGGTAVVPDRFLATRAISVSPRGLSRPGNRVFAQLFRADAFARLPYAQGTLVRSPRGLLRRLDGFTCAGCHQSRALAGFHLPGEERDPARTFNALAVGVSPHLHEELAWRSRLVSAAATGTAFAEPRPFPERAGRGGYGAHCGLGDPGFAGWTCADGLTCRDSAHDEVGVCAPAAPAAGDGCEDARVVGRPGASGDQVVADRPASCQAVARRPLCVGNDYGFPSGFCTESCARPGERAGATVCTQMLLSGYEQACFPLDQPIEACVAEQRLVAAMTSRACSVDQPCRDDYGCLRYPGSAPGTGACVPPYFLFDFRVDGPRLDR